MCVPKVEMYPISLLVSLFLTSILSLLHWYHKINNTYPPTHLPTHFSPHLSSPLLPLYSSSGKLSVLVQIHVLAYIFTRSVHVPRGILAATLFGLNPFSSKTLIYQGSRPELLIKTLPPSLRARLTALHCAGASGPPGVNQSILSMRTAMVRDSGCIRAKTSASSSVWIRMLSRAVGEDSLEWDLGER